MTTNTRIMPTESESKSSPETKVQLTIKCRIEKFDFEDDYISEDVSSELAPRVFWDLEIESMCTFIHFKGPMADVGETLKATYHIYLIGAGGEIDSIQRGIEMFSSEEDTGGGQSIELDRVKRALQADGSLVVAVDIEFLAPDDSSAKAICESTLHGYENRGRWADTFSEFYGNETLSDCSIEIGGETLPAHKLPLAASSPVFRAMFTNPLAEESKSGVIKVTDSKEPAPMRALLRYCYQGQLDAETMEGEWTVEIFTLACKYRIDNLKALLQKHYIEKKLSVGNVVGMAALADTYSAEKLKEACIKLMAREGKTVFESSDWKQLMKANPTLAAELAVAAYNAK